MADAPVLILALSPFETPDARLVVAFCRAGALGVLDLGRDDAAARVALADVEREVRGSFGVRIPAGARFDPASLPRQVSTVIMPCGNDPARFAPRRTLVQVVSAEEGQRALRSGADGLVAKGAESGGRVSEESSFILLQRLMGTVERPVWVQGGIGVHTAAAAIAGGASGVVLDSQLACVRESGLPPAVRAAVAAMDGSETAVVAGHRVLARPDLPQGDRWHVGQDAAFAGRLAAQYETAEGVVRAVRESITGQLRLAKDLRPLGPGAPWARAHGVRYPIAQGPMTRVSDQPGFAEAVAEAGALPFLALSLMRKDEVRRLLTETAGRLGTRPFGVGILGFVPPELREEQIEAILAARPPAALIAGGRPSQARRLEAAGIPTYLHVPSPGLLDLFLDDGARRFVFEGSECGGHVGPRTSFVLWESQLQRLLAFSRPEELSVLFAGGIHDGRSAAMVAAMAAPLADRGAKVGVLMGTAYLFTREAVESGAIVPGFQEAALECDHTVLLETAPGHQTRCLESGYVQAFREEKRRLEKEGLPPQQVWVALERLNLGRLRIAAKGLRRDGQELVAVDEPMQRREGMFMIGQVAALRSSVCGAEELHREVSEGSVARLEGLSVVPATAARAPFDVAIVGIACVFPGALDKEAFWSNVVRGLDSVTEVPKERWDPDIYFDPRGPTGEKTPSKWGGFLPDVPFDPLAYGIPPRSLASIEPVQLLSLEMARRALDDAGYADRAFDRERTSVIFGAEAGTELSGAYGFRALYPQYVGELTAELEARLPRLTEDSFPGVLANVIAGRIANRLDLGGANYTVDAACASSLAAVDLACKELTDGTSDMVLCGGADLHNGIQDYLLFGSVHALSPSGRCRAFDAEADGIVLGEGAAVLVLKRRADAEREGDRIYAVIEGVGSSSDGRSLGLTAPRREGQVRALRRAYSRAGVSPATVGLVEAHGTGTVIGDRTELQTLADVFQAAGAGLATCAVGSVKSQIGHTKCAAGLAGMIKAALAIHHRVLPPTLHLHRPNPAWDPTQSPFTFSRAARPWPDERPRAGVSAFGFGGTNFHVVLAAPEGGTRPESGQPAWPAELFLFRGESRTAAESMAARVEAVVAGEDPPALRDLAAAVADAGRGPVQLAVVAADARQLAERLSRARSSTPGEGVFVAGGPTGKVALLFPGQGSQYPGMLQDLFVAFPKLHRFLRLGAKWAGRMLPPTAFTPEAEAAQREALTDTRVAQPVLGLAGLAGAELLASLEFRADLLAGHSYGELVALAVAGAIPEEALLPLSEDRADSILRAVGADPGGMAAVTASAALVGASLAEAGVSIACINASDQTVIAGPTTALESAVERLRAAGLTVRPLPSACAFHTPLMAAAEARFAEHLARASISPPRVPVFAGATASPYPADADGVRRGLAAQLARPVLFAETIEAMYAEGTRIFVEVGPGAVLTGLVGRILQGRPHVAVALDAPGSPGVPRLLLAVAQLAVSGVQLSPRALFAGRGVRRVELDRTDAGDAAGGWVVNGGGARPRGAELPVEVRRATVPDRPRGVPSTREGIVLEYLQGLRRVVEAQREVVMRYLEAAPSPRPLSANEAAAQRGAGRAATKPPAASQPVDEPREQPPVPAETEAASPPLLPADQLLSIVSEKTGYPVQMLDLDLDLEADLSIDSIKRVEILGLLGRRIGIGSAPGENRDRLLEELAGLKTLRAIVGWLEKRAPERQPSPAVEASLVPHPPTSFGPQSVSVPRYRVVLERAPAPLVEAAQASGRLFVLTDDGRGVAPRVARLLTESGAAARVLAAGEAAAGVTSQRPLDGLLHLSSLAPHADGHEVKGLFLLAREAGGHGLHWLLSATGLGGSFGLPARGGNRPLHGGGMSGLLKSIGKEWPGVRVRAVDLDPAEPPEVLARHIFEELFASDGPVDVGYADGARHLARVVRAPRPQGLVGVPRESLGPSSVVVATGGARGITAEACIALARRHRCRLELVGRTPVLAEEHPDLAGAQDLPSLRRRLIADEKEREPAAIEAACRQILATREIRRSVEAMRRAGSEVSYHAVDVRDPSALGSLLEGFYALHGRIDGVIHGAGLLEDRLLPDKTAESFDRVYDTKVQGALNLAAGLRGDVGFVVFFSSIAGVFGNRGQADYAAANDALDKIASALQRRLNGRVLSIAWGPWRGAGMVSAELEAEYARQGVGLIDPPDGAREFLEELSAADAREGPVILMRADPEWLG